MYMNELFGAEVLLRTLDRTVATSDTSGLFVRAARLIDTGATARDRAARRPEPKRDGPQFAESGQHVTFDSSDAVPVRPFDDPGFLEG